jgi:hypothetical protein
MFYCATNNATVFQTSIGAARGSSRRFASFPALFVHTAFH